jgi:hypothetical protein
LPAPRRWDYTFVVTMRICYVHAGPHKTGTKSIQWFLKENRTELLKRGYFVPESGNIHGGHHAIVRDFCGQELPEHQRSAASNFVRALEKTQSEAVILSSESLDGLLRKRDYAEAFFHRIKKLNLEPKLVLFVRNQSQLINSRYAQVVKGFRCCESFEAFVQGLTQRPNFRYSPLIELTDAFHAQLIPRRFNEETIAYGVVPAFLQAIGIDPSQFPDTGVHRNPAAGPFTVSVARYVLRSISTRGTQLSWMQAERCKNVLLGYLQENGWADTGYCGLKTSVARQIEKEWRSDNNTFAQRVWGRPWEEIFATDIGREFTPNDFEMSPPHDSIQRRFCQAVWQMTALVEEILREPGLAVEAAWNDLRRRSGLDFKKVNCQILLFFWGLLDDIDLLFFCDWIA